MPTLAVGIPGAMPTLAVGMSLKRNKPHMPTTSGLLKNGCHCWLAQQCIWNFPGKTLLDKPAVAPDKHENVFFQQTTSVGMAPESREYQRNYSHSVPVLLAAVPGDGDGAGLALVAAAMIGLAVALVAWWIVRALQIDDPEQGAQWRYDVSRVRELRRLDLLYRLFQPVLQMFARLNRAFLRESRPAVQREIQAAGLPRFWLAEEYLARAELIALLLTPVYVYLFFGWFGPPGMLLVAAAVALTAWLLRRRLAARAAARLKDIKARLPFLLDLLTLLMEAGSTFLGALAEACEEFRGHPVAEEFGRVLTDMNLGKTRVEAFRAMRDRLGDDEIASIIGSILQAEELGTPLAGIFRVQADVLRVKRSQRAEAIAGEAGVKMLLPGVLVMIATILIILGPFLLNFLDFGMTIQ